MSELRYCTKCKTNTLHDTERKFLPTDTRAERWIWGLVSLGLSEVMCDTYATCQRCGKQRII